MSLEGTLLAIFGLALGLVLEHTLKFVVQTEIDLVMFGRAISMHQALGLPLWTYACLLAVGICCHAT